MIQAEPKRTGFLSPSKVQTQSSSTNQVKTTVRSGEARQSSQVDEDYSRNWRKEHPNYHKNYNKIYFQNGWAKAHSNINSRCNNKNHHYYKKGIKNFLRIRDLKFLWFRDKAYLLKKASIDRINPKDNYTLENCRFIELEDNTHKYKKGFDVGRNITKGLFKHSYYY